VRDPASRNGDSRELLDGQSLAAVTDAHADDLYRFALHLVRDPHRAQDLVQDTLLRSWERRVQFRGAASLRTWLHRILHNLAIDQVRRSRREVTVEEVDERWRDESYTVDTAAVVERAALRDELEDGLVRVPELLRTPLVLHDVEGWTVLEIADLLNISLSAAKQRLRRGRMALVTALAAGAERRDALIGIPLRCWDARRHVSDYLDGELDPALTSQVQAHLETCPTCPPLYAALVGVHDHLGRLRDPDSVIPSGTRAQLARARQGGR
jgi:RNA polymerase sigma-70 factor (ECF subfamily)